MARLRYRLRPSRLLRRSTRETDLECRPEAGPGWAKQNPAPAFYSPHLVKPSLWGFGKAVAQRWSPGSSIGGPDFQTQPAGDFWERRAFGSEPEKFSAVIDLAAWTAYWESRHSINSSARHRFERMQAIVIPRVAAPLPRGCFHSGFTRQAHSVRSACITSTRAARNRGYRRCRSCGNQQHQRRTGHG